MASSQILKNANGNVVALENPDTNFSNKTINISKLEDNLGIGQTWQEMIGSRSLGVTYTNTTDKPILISIFGDTTVIGGNFQLILDGISWSVIGRLGIDMSIFRTSTILIPIGSTYVVNAVGSNMTSWLELRD